MPSTGTKSPLAKAQAGAPGKQANNMIAQGVVDRIVANSTPQFQEFLARSGNGSAAMAAAQAASMAPPMPLMPPPSSQPVSAPAPPYLSPMYQAPAAAMSGMIPPPPPSLGFAPNQMEDMVRSEQLLRALGLI